MSGAKEPAGPRPILVAGIGNVFLRDDGFGPEVVRRLRDRELPPEVRIFDFGTGGLNLAYELMRGYEALVLVDASHQGGEPGTLYVIEPDPDEIEGEIRDGEGLDPHGMDPVSVLRFVKSVAGWPGRVLVVACEPAEVEDLGIGLSPAVAEAAERAAATVEACIAELRGPGGPEAPDERSARRA